MNIYKTAVNNPITTILVFVAISIFGVFSLVKLPIDFFPHIETTNIMVITAYPGASAIDIEENVTRPLENTLNSVEDLKHISSQSKENISVVLHDFSIKDLVYIEPITGMVHDLRPVINRGAKDGGKLRLSGLPMWDSPIFLMNKEVLKIKDEQSPVEVYYY